MYTNEMDTYEFVQFIESARRIAQLPKEETEVEFAIFAQAEVVLADKKLEATEIRK